jgi:hypothetical protein
MYFHDRREPADAPHTLEWPWYASWVCVENPAHFQLVTDAEYRENRSDPYSDLPHPPARLSPGQPGELLFAFVRASDGARLRCELRFHGESYGWEAQFLEGGGFSFYARGGFVTRALAVQWAEVERAAMEATR